MKIWYAMTTKDYKEWDNGTYDEHEALEALRSCDCDAVVIIDEESNVAIGRLTRFDI